MSIFPFPHTASIIRYLTLALAILATTGLRAQHSKQNATPIEVNFLLNYYDQDGNHSAVTGGSGTEKLEDRASKIIVHLPLDSSSSLETAVGINYYTSASSDNINSNRSSASSDDFRAEWLIRYAETLPTRHQVYGFQFSGSSETDYISIGAGVDWSMSSQDQNRWIQAAVNGYYDTWMPIFPDELRQAAGDLISSYHRHTYSFSTTIVQILNRRTQLSLNAELIQQWGLLSTPFHRIYFSDFNGSGLEQLPDRRTKFPIAMRLHHFFGDHILIRLQYRFYIDSFDITAHTFNLETPLKLTNTFSLYPFYRFHSQLAAQYFQEHGEHQSGNRYGTSDYDLSRFHSHKSGLGLRYSPLYGIAQTGIPLSKVQLILKECHIRYATYSREDGLEAYTVSLNLGWILQ